MAALNLEEACREVGCGRTKMLEHLRTHPHHCRRVGRKYVFDPEHIEAIKLAMDPRNKSDPGAASHSRASHPIYTPGEWYERAMRAARKREEECMEHRRRVKGTGAERRA